VRISIKEAYNVGRLFKKPSYKAPSYKAPTPAAAPAPEVEGATKKPEEDSSRKKKKKQGKASLIVDSTNNAIGSGGTGINL
jgi:hypothetical protein